MGTISDVILTPLKVIPGDLGEVMHALKGNEKSFYGFGEAYFSTVNKDAIKGWKRHTKMILNLIVPVGAIRFVLFDDRLTSKSVNTIQEIILSKDNYQRLTVPPGVWMAFQGLSDGQNLLLNIASIPHDPLEAENLDISNPQIPFKGFR
jgi:dTDP-4-dehydrorhamnose 3,5-epimerase